MGKQKYINRELLPNNNYNTIADEEEEEKNKCTAKMEDEMLRKEIDICIIKCVWQ